MKKIFLGLFAFGMLQVCNAQTMGVNGEKIPPPPPLHHVKKHTAIKKTKKHPMHVAKKHKTRIKRDPPMLTPPKFVKEDEKQ